MKTSNVSDSRFLTDPEIAAATRHTDGGPVAFAAPVVVPLDRVHVSQDYLSADVAAKFSIGFGAGSGGASNQTRAFLLVYEAMIESAATPRLLNQAIWDEVQAIGVYIQIKVTESKTVVKFDAFSVAAAVQLGLAKAEFQTQVLPSDAAALQHLLPPSGIFNMESFDQILVGIGKVKDALADSAAALVPQRYYRPRGLLSELEADLAAAQTIAFGMRELAKSKYVETAVEDATDRQLDPTLIRLVYEARWPAVQPHVDPDDQTIEDARAWLADPLGL